jgi:large subunit ribosomal protein L9
MKVLIKATGEIKEVSNGYAFNYLLPQKLAVLATEARLAEWKKAKAKKLALVKGERLKNRQLAEKFDGKVIELKVLAGKAGKIHGSITKKEIAKELGILKANVGLDKPIKKVGEYEVELVFGKTKAKIKIKVEAKTEAKNETKRT